MKKAADNFLKKAGEQYETNKKKWKKIIENKGYVFSEDIYNDSILKVYDAIIKKEVENDDYMSYWLTVFIHATIREHQYKHNNIKKINIDEIEEENDD